MLPSGSPRCAFVAGCKRRRRRPSLAARPPRQEPLLWAWLCSLSLRDVKGYVVETARRELRTESFAVCCAKLAFLPAVVVVSSFVEVTGGATA
jgi:hypothetical protein